MLADDVPALGPTTSKTDRPFEPTVVIPENPLSAAITFYGVMAYPDRGAGQPGGDGLNFAGALHDWMVWQHRRVYGLPATRNAFNNPELRIPEWSSFQGTLERGLVRIRRRLVVLDLFHLRMLKAMSAAGRRQCTLSELEANTPPWGRMIAGNVHRWAKRSSLNRVGRGDANPSVKIKDFKRRVIQPSLPVLHMAQGLWVAGQGAASKIRDWNSRSKLAALLANPDLWIDEAIDVAESFRQNSRFRGFHGELGPTDMIELVKKNGRIMPP